MTAGKVLLELDGVELARDGRAILQDITWCVRSGERWVVLGPNGSGKTSLCRIASLYTHPSRGRVVVLEQRLGRTDVRALRTRIGISSHAVADMMRPGLRTVDVVVTGKYAALTPWWHEYSDADRRQAMALLDRFGCSHLSEARFGTLSAGERQRVLLGRTLMNNPPLLVLDEPTAGLDLAGREQLVTHLASMAATNERSAIVLVTHHAEEIPPGFTHVLLLSNGRLLACGPLEETLTAERLSECFGVALKLERRNGRWVAWGI